jgi:hypothetical protein
LQHEQAHEQARGRVTRQRGSNTGPTPGTESSRACASKAAVAVLAFSPVALIRAAISPLTIGVEKDVPLHLAMP